MSGLLTKLSQLHSKAMQSGRAIEPRFAKNLYYLRFCLNYIIVDIPSPFIIPLVATNYEVF